MEKDFDNFELLLWDDAPIPDPQADQMSPKLLDYGCRRKALFLQKWSNPGSKCLPRSHYILIGNILILRGNIRRDYGDLIAKRVRHISDNSWERYLLIEEKDVQQAVLKRIIEALRTLTNPITEKQLPSYGINRFEMEDLIAIERGGNPVTRYTRQVVWYPDEVALLKQIVKIAIADIRRTGNNADIDRIIALQNKILGPKGK